MSNKNQTFKSDYSEKLRDPRWQKLRLKIMERDGFKCRCCFSGTKTLNVHHLIYSGNPWEANPEHLETLCKDCHTKREEFQKNIINAIKLIPTIDFIDNDCSFALKFAVGFVHLFKLCFGRAYIHHAHNLSRFMIDTISTRQYLVQSETKNTYELFGGDK